MGVHRKENLYFEKNYYSFINGGTQEQKINSIENNCLFMYQWGAQE